MRECNSVSESCPQRASGLERKTKIFVLSDYHRSAESKAEKGLVGQVGMWLPWKDQGGHSIARPGTGL